ncbi:tubulin polyglutamylase TTLL11-like [Sinocyclocheilus grahami]|uniref:tubulin polyglutamylase TTLL11-like n=1 Tax=Sinocyclocheilus grahami TaxID=75366 RepID=UPI0007AC9823|nr:PREDICTED: tubulin polyglutamylase TTLL11-like [Sinocyclocheilus grahami]
MSDHYERVKIELQQMKEVENEAAADEEQLSPATASSIPADVSFTAWRDLSRSSVNGRSRSKSRSKADGHERQVNGKQLADPTAQKSDSSQGQSRVSNEPNLHIKGTARLLKSKTAANGHVESCLRHTDGKCEHHGKEDGSKAAKKRRGVTVDTSKAKTSLEALKMSIRQLKWKEFPMGRRTACDIYWHGVSFHDNENIFSGQVNKFPVCYDADHCHHMLQVSPGVFEYVPSPVDEEVKVGVIRDTLRLMDPAQRKQHATSNTGGGSPEEAIVVETGSDEKEGMADSISSLCLKQVFPKYTKQFQYLRVVERIAALFLRFLGVKGTMRLGPTSFRTFIRNCKLSNSSFSMASADILYIDITRRWAAMLPDSREAGMCLQAFIEAFFYLAARRFKALPLREQVLLLLEVCEGALEGQSHSEKPRPHRSHTNTNPASSQTSAPTTFSSPALTRRRHRPLQLSAKANTEN